MPNRKSHVRILTVFGALYVLAWLFAMSSFLQNSYLGDKFPLMDFDSMINGTANKPFVYRQLVPMLVIALDTASPEMVSNGINNMIDSLKEDRAYSSLRSLMPWLNRSFPYHDSHHLRFLACLIIGGFFAGYMITVHALARDMFPQEPALALCAPLVAVLAFTSFSYQWQYLYDIPTLCLSSVCFYCLYRGYMRAYLLAFFLYCLNKETAFFMLAFFALWNWNRMDSKKFAILWGIQCLCFLVIKIGFTMYFVGNKGFFLEENIGIVLKRDLLAISNVDRLVNVTFIWFLLVYRWMEKPIFLKKALLIFPLMAVAYLFYGFPEEYRVFFDLHAPLVLLASHTLIIGTGFSQASFFNAIRERYGASYR